MGTILNANCNCGYHVEGLFHGVGMTSHTSSEVVACGVCRILWVSANIKPGQHCRVCHGPIDVISLAELPPDAEASDDDDDYRVAETDYNATYKCPACGATTLRFAFGGCWD